METTGTQREIWIDWLRVTACFLVMMTHSCEPFYLGGEGSLILTKADAVWVSILNVLPRAAVALFIVASSYLQFPLRYPTGEFFRRRALRILSPFLFWTVVYALVWGEPVQNFKDLLLNFNYAAGHLWFVYMLIGLYLVMPLLSPWAEKVGKKELQVYLGIWLFTTIIPLVRQWAGGSAPVIYGPSGIPNAAKYPLWGEASWNTYGLFYYMSGFVGYPAPEGFGLANPWVEMTNEEMVQHIQQGENKKEYLEINSADTWKIKSFDIIVILCVVCP